MHSPGHLRDPLLEAFDRGGLDWHRQFRSKAHPLKALGKLWNSTDTVPSDTRDTAADWYSGETCDEDGEKYIRGGCSFAQLVRRLMPLVREMPDWARKPRSR